MTHIQPSVAPTRPEDPQVGDNQAVPRTANASVIDIVSSVTVDDWDRPTPCEGWEVLALVHHP